jgi:hypothetical protein
MPFLTQTKSGNMSDTFNIVVGDWSHDGHSHTDTQLISTALTYSDVENAWGDVNQKLHNTYGFNLHDVCDTYEDNLLTKEQSDAFISMGINIAEFCESSDEYVYDDDNTDAEFALDSDSFVELILRLLNQHSPLLALERSNYTRRKELHVGGYGLFSD